MTYFDQKLTDSPRFPAVRFSAATFTFKGVSRGLTALVDTLLDWQDRARQRRQLLGLSDMALRDFGASRADAEHEGGKPAWN